MTADADIQEPRPVVLADGRGMPGHEDEPTRRVFTRMAIGTAVPLVTIIVGGYFASVGLAEREVLANIRMLNEAIAHPLVEPTSDRLLIGDRAALAALDDTVKSHLLPDTPVERVKLWAPDGQIVYSDQARLIGEVFPLGDDQLGVLRSGGSSTDVSDLKADENRLERAEGDARLLEVYAPVPTDSGGGLLFETYVRYDILEQRQHDVLTSFAWIGLLGSGSSPSRSCGWPRRTSGGCSASARVWRAQRRGRRGAAPAGRPDLHDGVGQDLLGAAYLVTGGTAPLRAAGRDDAADTLRSAETSIRTSIRSLRSLLIDLYPADLRTVGLRAALLDLVARSRPAAPRCNSTCLRSSNCPSTWRAPCTGPPGRLCATPHATAVQGCSRCPSGSPRLGGTGRAGRRHGLRPDAAGRGRAPRAARPRRRGRGARRDARGQSAPGRGTELRLVLPR